MSFFTLAAKRLFRSLPFLVSLLLMLLTVTASLYTDRGLAEPTAGYATDSSGPETEALLERLSTYGFRRYASEQELREAIADGSLDCGAVFSDDLEARITSANLENSVLFVCSPTAHLPMLFRLELVSELLTSASPYFSTPILNELAPTADLGAEIAERYRQDILSEQGFVFDIETINGTPPKEVGFDVSLAVTTLSVFLFLMPLLTSCRLFGSQYKGLEKRLGERKTLATVFFPEALLSLLVTIGAVCLVVPLGGRLSGEESFLEWLVPAIIASLLCAAFGLLLPLVLRRADTLQMLTVPVLLATLVLCPLFINIAILIPSTNTLRLFLPTFWIFAAKESPLLFGAIAIVSLPLSARLLLLSKRKTQYRRDTTP